MTTLRKVHKFHLWGIEKHEGPLIEANVNLIPTSPDISHLESKHQELSTQLKNIKEKFNNLPQILDSTSTISDLKLNVQDITKLQNQNRTDLEAEIDLVKNLTHEEIQALEPKFKALEDKLKEIKSQYQDNNIQQQLEVMSNKLITEDDIKSLNNDIEFLSQDLVKFKRSVNTETLQNDITEHENKIYNIQQQLEVINNKLITEDDIKSLNNDIELISQDLAKTKQNVNTETLQNDISKHATLIDNIQQDMSDINNNNTELKKNIQNLQGEYMDQFQTTARHNSDIANLQIELESYKKSLAEIKENVSNLNTYNEKLNEFKSKLETLDELTQSLNESLDTFATIENLNEVKKSVSDLQSLLRTYTNIDEISFNQIKENLETLEAQKLDLNKFNELFAKLETDIQSVSDKENLTAANIEKIHKDLEEIETVFISDEEYNSLKLEYNELKTEISNQGESIQDLSTSYNSYKKKLENISNKLQAIKTNRLSKLSDLEKEITALSSNVHRNIENYSTLQREMNEKLVELKTEMHNKYAEHGRVNTLQDVVVSLNNKLSEADVILKRNSVALETLKSSFESLSSQDIPTVSNESEISDLKLKISEIFSRIEELKATALTEASIQELKDKVEQTENQLYDELKQRLMDNLQTTVNIYITTSEHFQSVTRNISNIINNIQDEYSIIQLFSTKNLEINQNIKLHTGTATYKFFKPARLIGVAIYKPSATRIFVKLNFAGSLVIVGRAEDPTVNEKFIDLNYKVQAGSYIQFHSLSNYQPEVENSTTFYVELYIKTIENIE